MARLSIFKYICLFLAVLCVLFGAGEAAAKFSMAKYRYSLLLFTDENLRKDYNNINNWKRNTYGPKLVQEYKKNLAAANPKMHPHDVEKNAEKRQEEYFDKNQKLLSAGSKLARQKELWKIIESFEDIEMERLKNFTEAYPLFVRCLISYESFVFFSYEIHAIFTPDHKAKWTIASDIVINLLKNKPSYISFSDKAKETAFYNNVVNYLTNNFKEPQLLKIAEFMSGSLGQRLLKISYETFEERVRLTEEIYSENYPYYAALPPEKQDDREFK